LTRAGNLSSGNLKLKQLETNMRAIKNTTRRNILKGGVALGGAAVAPAILAQTTPVKIGYTMARTGPWTGGAQVTQEPNYLLWAEQ
jgi:branched-chain amino acid transport system substrate-binding protein